MEAQNRNQRAKDHRAPLGKHNGRDDDASGDQCSKKTLEEVTHPCCCDMQKQAAYRAKDKNLNETCEPDLAHLFLGMRFKKQSDQFFAIFAAASFPDEH